MTKPDLASYTAERTVSKEDLEPLDDLLRYIKKNNLNVLFVSTPFPIDEISYAYEKYVEAYLSEKGFSCLNCNKLYDEIGLDFSTDFYDDRHCNLLGSIKFSKYISSYLTDVVGIKPSELSAELKSEWDTAYTLWYDEKAVPGIEKIKESLINPGCPKQQD